MSFESTIFRAFRSEKAVTRYANWCADSLVAQRHFARSRVDFRSFRTSVDKMTPGTGGYQRTNFPYANDRILESYESLAGSNVRGWKSRLGKIDWLQKREAPTRWATQGRRFLTLLNRGCRQDQKGLITAQHPKVRA